MALPGSEILRRELLAGITAELDMLERVKGERERQRWNHVWACMMLANDIDTWFELCAGRPVPQHRIDQDWKAILDARPTDDA